MKKQQTSYFKFRLSILKAVLASLVFIGFFSSCGSKKKLHHHVLHVNDLYLGKDSTSVDNMPDTNYSSPNQDAVRYGVRPTD